MPMLTVGDRTFSIRTVEKNASWRAHAVSLEHGDRFGVELVAPTEAEAIDRMRRWLEWQHEHVSALAELRSAERAYHRSIADEAFSTGDHAAVSEQARRAALDRIESARVKLDEVRTHQPQ